MMRRTKIVATLGPATDNPDTIAEIIKNGVDVVRLNFSHGKPDEHRRRAEQVRHHAGLLKRTVGILGDLQGPKIRITRFKSGKITLQKGDEFTLDAPRATMMASEASKISSINSNASARSILAMMAAEQPAARSN